VGAVGAVRMEKPLHSGQAEKALHFEAGWRYGDRGICQWRIKGNLLKKDPDKHRAPASRRLVCAAPMPWPMAHGEAGARQRSLKPRSAGMRSCEGQIIRREWR
jgi:hypothetical protein